MATASSNEFELIGPQGVEHYPHSAATLSCSLSPGVRAVDMEIRWFKGTDCVCLYKNRQVTEASDYEGRVSLFTKELERGNVSLQLRDCRESDRGDYLCQVTSGDRTEELTVDVALWFKALMFKALPVFKAPPVEQDHQKGDPYLGHFHTVTSTHGFKEEDPYLRVIVCQTDRTWTEEERMKMEKSVLTTVSGETPAATLKRTGSIEWLPPTMSGEPSGPDSTSSVCVPELRLVLLGRTGSGKGAAGNVILGREETSKTDTSTERQQSESRQGEVAGRQVTVVDTLDWFCPGLSLEELRQDVGHCIRLSAPGPHAFLLVLPVKQSTGEERGMLEKMEEIFGERCWRNTIILFTVTEEVQANAEEFIRSGTQEVQRLVEKCGNRFHCLNIKESGDCSQVSELLERIDDMLTGNGEEIYSSEIYLG